MFIRGINYWPIKKAMYWWKDFDHLELSQDFQRLSPHFNLVRIFLLWEDFQPRLDLISKKQLTNILAAADIAEENGLSLMPTFFCGHMSGVNWMPDWILDPSPKSSRFPIYTNGRIIPASIRNFYVEPELIEAQLYQIRTICKSLAGHPSIHAYDLGNEPSNCVQPPNRSTAQSWLHRMCQAVRESSGGTPVTLGMHAEDLEEDRQLWPQDAAQSCDFLSMHGYPFYLSWVNDPLDVDLVPFLGLLTSYLGQKSVLFQEFGAPTNPTLYSAGLNAKAQQNLAFFSESAVLDYYVAVLDSLHSAGMLGGMAWCFADYAPGMWHQPPLEKNLHERYFGLFRHDGTAKPILNAFQMKPEKGSVVSQSGRETFRAYLERMDRDRFYDQPMETLPQLFTVYKNLCKGSK